MPPDRKVLLGAAAGYLVIGRDLVPDDIPIIGGLDDLVVVVLAVDLFLDGVPTELLQEKLDELGIDRGRSTGHRPDPALDAGPGPSDHPPRPRPRDGRRTRHRSIRHPAADRAWINKEEPIT